MNAALAAETVEYRNIPSYFPVSREFSQSQTGFGRLRRQPPSQFGPKSPEPSHTRAITTTSEGWAMSRRDIGE
jgi:hypothetical protein